jgi:hypothetical protein
MTLLVFFLLMIISEPKGKKVFKASVDLPDFSTDVDIRKLNRTNLFYDQTTKQLSIDGIMSDHQRISSSNFSNSKQYKRAIRSLFLRSQDGS